MKALILGASGHLGNAIVRELIDRGDDVTAVTRRDTPSPNLEGLPVRWLFGDADQSRQLDAWVPGHDVVVDAAAPYPTQLFVRSTAVERNPAQYAGTRTQGLLRATRRHDAILATISSFVTLPVERRGFENLRAQTFSRIHPYFAVKHAIERHLLAASDQGQRIVIINPTTCLGPFDLKQRELCFVPQAVAGDLPASMRHVINIVDVRDVACAVATAITQRVYGVPIPVSGHNVSGDELVDRLCAMSGQRRPTLRGASSTAGTALSLWADLAYACVGAPSPQPSLAMMLVCMSYAMAPGRIQHELKVEPRELEETLRDSIEWYRGRGFC